MIRTLIVVISYIVLNILGSYDGIHCFDEYTSDGFRNNLNQPTWGMAGSNFMRGSPVAYSDGAYEMGGKNKPNPLEISLRAFRKMQDSPSQLSRNVLQAVFSQLVLDEVAQFYMTGCPPEYENMDLPDMHPLRNFTDTPMVYLRSSYDQSTGYTSSGPRQQVNLVSSFMDGGVIYGGSQVWTNLIRSFSGGQLLADNQDIKSSFPTNNEVKLPFYNAPIPRDHTLKHVDRLFRIGNAKGHENPFLLALQIVWFRWHNKVARDYLAASSNRSDDEIFELARRKVIATFQKIAMKEWLPAFLNGHNPSSTTRDIANYTRYNSRTQPGITQEFLAAMEYRNSLLPSAVWMLGDQCLEAKSKGRGRSGQDITVNSVRFCNNYWDPLEFVKDNLESILRGMIYTLGRYEDGTYSSDFTDYFYGPFEYSRTDLVALQIQRFRDHGLSGLNAIRKAYGLAPRNDWSTLGGQNGKLHKLYDDSSPDNADILIGVLLEEGNKVNGMSDLARAVLVEQFTRLRDTDRFWYENKGIFTDSEIQEIESITFSEILESVTNISQLPENIFLCQRNSNNSPSSCHCRDPPNVFNLSDPNVDVCSPLSTYDYIEGSKTSFVLSFLALALVIPVSIAVLYYLVKRRQVSRVETKKRESTLFLKNESTKFIGKEYLGAKSGYRNITGELKSGERRIFIRDGQRKDLRYVDFNPAASSKITAQISNDKDISHVCLKIPGDIDLVLKFPDVDLRQMFVTSLRTFFSDMGITLELEEVSEFALYSNASVKDQRRKLLDKFFRAVCFTVFEGTLEDPSKSQMGLDQIDEVIGIKLTITEFADAMGMQPSSVFVKNVFLLADKDNNNFLSFEEFFHLFGIFIKGNAEQKGMLLFNIYDVRKLGYLTKDEFYKMIKSLLDLAESDDLTDDAVKELVKSMYSHVGLSTKQNISYEDFRKIFCANEFTSTLKNATVMSQATKYAPIKPGARKDSKRNTFIGNYKFRHETNGHGNTSQNLKDSAALRVSVKPQEYPGTAFAKRYYKVSRYFHRYRWQIFWCTLYTLVTIGIFVERAFYFARGREHAGLRRMSGAWVTAMIRGSASVIMFTYSSLLVTMCRNIITALRETFLHRFIPFDSAVDFHKYIAVLAMIATILHVITHGINLYCMCTQSTTSINCFFGEYFTDSHSFATFHFWAFQTITGLAGILVTVLIFVMYVFAAQYARRHVFKSFWVTHGLYWLVYVLTFLHGIGRLVQAPLFAWYLIGPLILFVIDRLMSISRNRVEIAVKHATPLPSGVLRLVFKRPKTFQYKSGQWVRIACPELSRNEYHPFTLTSAPHEPHLSLHIRAVGPWTTNLRKTYSPGSDGPKLLPNIFLDGPFGEGHQDWYSNEVAVLVGGGIGVTPFASILKDIAFKSKSGIQVTCKKVYFIWVTRTQKSFEWLVDLLRGVEAADVKRIVDTHIFVTQFQQRYDLRTTMLYICERYFQKVEGKSLFTGLRAVTHFGRPNFEDFFTALATEHKQVSQVGVFSCGPGPMTSGVQKACNYMNGLIGPTFSHHFENF